MGRIVKITQKGNFDKTNKFLKTDRDKLIRIILEEYAVLGLHELVLATPVDTGKTANSWDYSISKNNKGWQVTWTNSNINEGLQVVMLIRFGHGTRSGGYVPPNDFVTPAMRPIFESLADEAWREVTNAK